MSQRLLMRTQKSKIILLRTTPTLQNRSKRKDCKQVDLNGHLFPKQEKRRQMQQLQYKILLTIQLKDLSQVRHLLIQELLGRSQASQSNLVEPVPQEADVAPSMLLLRELASTPWWHYKPRLLQTEAIKAHLLHSVLESMPRWLLRIMSLRIQSLVKKWTTSRKNTVVILQESALRSAQCFQMLMIVACWTSQLSKQERHRYNTLAHHKYRWLHSLQHQSWDQ